MRQWPDISGGDGKAVARALTWFAAPISYPEQARQSASGINGIVIYLLPIPLIKCGGTLQPKSTCKARHPD